MEKRQLIGSGHPCLPEGALLGKNPSVSKRPSIGRHLHSRYRIREAFVCSLFATTTPPACVLPRLQVRDVSAQLFGTFR
jgi:hypothetical protein